VPSKQRIYRRTNGKERLPGQPDKIRQEPEAGRRPLVCGGRAGLADIYATEGKLRH